MTRVVDVQQMQRRRRGVVLVAAVPVAAFALAYVVGGGRSPVPVLLAAVGLVVVLAVVSLTVKALMRRNTQ